MRSRNFFNQSIVVMLILIGCATTRSDADQPSQAQLDFFEKKIRPVLVQQCYECHSEKSDELGGGLRVDLREGLIVGGESGPAIVPKNADESVLIEALEYETYEMPPDKKLPENIIADFRKWIQMGAPDPRDGKMEMAEHGDESPAQQTTELWSLQPVQNPQPPQVNSNWPRHDIDKFVFRKLQQHQLEPVSDADPLDLLRRLSFDLVGLPPTLEQQDQFLKAYDRDPRQAIAHFTDEMLASPQFGERWGRHWLDVVRYAESTGNSRDVLMPDAWRYRDYVIDSFNADIPYDRFVTEQIAGDLLSAENPAEQDRLSIATGMLAIGSKSLNGGNLALDIPDDQIDVIGKSMLGLTVSCARCHDHKFDPIPTADYYGLVGIFRSTKTYYGGGTRRPKDDLEKAKDALPLGKDADKKLAQLRAHEKEVNELTKKQTNLNKEIKTLTKKLPKDWKEQLAAIKTKLETIESTSKEEDASTSPREQLDEKEQKQLAQMEKLVSAQEQVQQLNAELKKLRQEQLPEIEFALAVQDDKKIMDYPIQIRGEKNKAGEIVPRGFLSCVSVENVPEITDQESGRRELAQWITQPDHPLTPRVAVNRVWQHLFGKGIVETVDNFGVNGLPPSHPELLDYLAHRFVHHHKWSLKSLIRELVLTRTYQLSSDYHAQNDTIDPANTYLWRMSRRRLEAEPFRDAILAVSGQLDLNRPEASLVTKVGEGEVGRGIKTEYLTEPFPHRSVYLPILRGIVPEFLKLFDLPEPSNPQGDRDTTNVPSQSLFLMNSPFVLEQSDATATRLIAASSNNDERIELVYRLCFTRSPTPDEVQVAREFIADLQPQMAKNDDEKQSAEQAAWSSLVQALFASAEFRFLP
ncbi:MAG: DUF1553 domain-containing protein [Planctomycetaceae bacterium]|nr:DUF1553 domain-containing protein [Planctomycetaceae bacterium]